MDPNQRGAPPGPPRPPNGSNPEAMDVEVRQQPQVQRSQYPPQQWHRPNDESAPYASNRPEANGGNGARVEGCPQVAIASGLGLADRGNLSQHSALAGRPPQSLAGNGTLGAPGGFRGSTSPNGRPGGPHAGNHTGPHGGPMSSPEAGGAPDSQRQKNSPPTGARPGQSYGGNPGMPVGSQQNRPPPNVPSGQLQPGSHSPSVAAASPPMQAPGMRELRVEDALLYLDDVKREFRDRPEIYNEFLGIMKNFKSQEVDTPGVITRVSNLFRGYNSLILGFNTFLPDGYKISLADLKRREAELMQREAAMAARSAPQVQPPQQPRASPPHMASHQAQAPRPQHQPQPHWGRDEGPRRSPENHTSPPQGPPPRQQQPQHPPPAPVAPAPHVMAAPKVAVEEPKAAPVIRAPAPPPQQNVAQQHQAVEFDHAISYVTKIKRRFASDPSTYHTFLEILHTYQKEQRGIKEVLEQVAHLFQDHPDLLKEFTFFLPDAVQEQAKERLHRAAAESESRQAAQRQQHLEMYSQSLGRGAPSGQHQKLIDMTRNQAPVAEPDPRGRKRPAEGPPPIVAPQQQQQQQPETFVYNSAVERQFFDAAREALTSYSRDGGQAWAEFLKCLDMFAQEILSRSEMLNFVEPLLGKRNTKLFEEFKRILAAAGSPSGSGPLMEDSWYSVPLSEIDFSRCRRCSPSYRALPRDYPAPPCSERNEDESKVLNDIWVSLPVGSEESYTFRHMRRNTNEETLFRVEDERFEIDMCIDSNAATLQLLRPIAEEIAMLSKEDVLPTDLGIKPPADSTGFGGKRFQYTFDKTVLGVIHRNSIARIYGDTGQEMLELMVKNPAVSIPLIVQRLMQKDEEWRSVRKRLNRSWKDLAEHNYYKSLDHRGLTWRIIDKRATSTRTLVSEIKDRAQNSGRESKDALKQKLDKAKEEHGSFYEVTKADMLSFNLDLTFYPKPDRRLFTPHLSMLYENNSWVQRDAYRILSFALERGPIAPADKERCHRLWLEFLGPWFELSLNWMQKPAVTYQESTAAAIRTTPVEAATVVSEDDDDSMEEELGTRLVTEELRQSALGDSKDQGYPDHHPLPSGAQVSTLYGEGRIIEFRRNDGVYAIALGFGATGYLRPATVLCSLLPVEKSAQTRQLRSDDLSKLARPGDQLAFGTQSLYIFFRLHQILVQRLNTAKRLAYKVGDDPSLLTLVEQIPNTHPQQEGRRRYEAYVSLVYALLDGGVGAEGGKYEDRVHSLLGHGAYELATMDKLITHIWKNLQSMASDETAWQLIQLHRRHAQAGSYQPEAMKQEAAYLAAGEGLYAFQHCPVPLNDQSVLYTEYLGVMEGGGVAAAAPDEAVDTEAAESLSALQALATAGAAAAPPPAKKARR